MSEQKKYEWPDTTGNLDGGRDLVKCLNNIGHLLEEIREILTEKEGKNNQFQGKKQGK
jgi:hypothetical protein